MVQDTDELMLRPRHVRVEMHRGKHVLYILLPQSLIPDAVSALCVFADTPATPAFRIVVTGYADLVPVGG